MEITGLEPTQLLPASGTGVGQVQGGGTTGSSAQSSSGKPASKGSGDTVELSADAKAELAKLKARDVAVRAHEAAHLAAAGGLAQGGPSYSYQKGPDGQNYAVGGEVSIDTSTIADNPSANMAKARQIRAAALAPADPSPQDQKVAAQATQMESDAAATLAKQTRTTGASTTAYRKAASTQSPRGLDVYA